jgi:putative endonuclease
MKTSGRLTHTIAKTLDRTAILLGRRSAKAKHLLTGESGEEIAYFHLRQLGYTMVARNFRSPRRKGEIDLIAWEEDVLCFIEVKTRSKPEFVPAEAAVDFDKRKELRYVAREYLRRVHHGDGEPPYRFDVVSVYLNSKPPRVDLIKAAFAIK